jgi:hypothetical protein
MAMTMIVKVTPSHHSYSNSSSFAMDFQSHHQSTVTAQKHKHKHKNVMLCSSTSSLIYACAKKTIE